MRRQTNPTRPQRALILAAGFRLQYRVLRCAATCFEAVYVYGADDAATLGLSSACAGFFPFNGSFREMDATVVARVNALCRQLSIDYVLPSCSDTTRFLAAFGGDLEVRHYPVPSLQVFDALNNKWLFARLCEELGVPGPATACFDTYQEVLDAGASGRLAYPAMIKPVAMWGSVGVMRIDRVEDLPAAVDYRPILVQDYVPGEDFCAFFMCRDGRIVGSISYTRTLLSITTGRDPEVSRYAAVMVQQLGYSGMIGFDVRRSPDGTVAFIECNPRFWYRMELARLAGLNVVELGFIDPPEAMPIEVRPGLELQLSRGLLKNAVMPWRLSRHDIAHIRYLARDPLLNTWAAARSLLGLNRDVADRTPAGAIRDASVEPACNRLYSIRARTAASPTAEGQPGQ